MDKLQVIDFIEKIKGAYSAKFETNKKTVDVWHEFLADMDYEVALKRLNRHIETDKFPPTIADIKTQKDRYVAQEFVPSKEDLQRVARMYGDV